MPESWTPTVGQPANLTAGDTIKAVTVVEVDLVEATVAYWADDGTFWMDEDVPVGMLSEYIAP